MTLSLSTSISSTSRSIGGDCTTPSWAVFGGAVPAVTADAGTPSAVANAWPAAMSGLAERGLGPCGPTGADRPPLIISAVMTDALPLEMMSLSQPGPAVPGPNSEVSTITRV